MNFIKTEENKSFHVTENDQGSRTEVSVDAVMKPTSSGTLDGHLLPDLRECSSASVLGNEVSKHETSLKILNRNLNIKEKCHFTFTLNRRFKKFDHSEFTAYGKPNESIFSALIANENLMETCSNRNIIVYAEKEIRGYVNLGMPLKCLPKDSHLKVILSQRKSSQQEDDQILRHCENPDLNCILFNIVAVGKTIKKILKVKELHEIGSTICVYALEGETVKEALYKDGRFRSDLSELDWKLMEGHNKIHRKESLVDDISGKTLDMVILKKKSVRKIIHENPKQKNENVTDKISPCDLIKSESKVQDSDRGRETEGVEHKRKKKIPPQSLRRDIEKKNYRTKLSIIFYYDLLKKYKKLKSQVRQRPYLSRHNITYQGIHEDAINLWLRNSTKLSSTIVQQYPNFKEVPLWLGKCFEEERKSQKVSPFEQFSIYEKNFGKESANSNSVATYECLIPLSKSVGFMTWNNINTGNSTCFSLKDGYILTCLHVVHFIVGEGTHPSLWPDTISKCAKVTFNYQEFCPAYHNWFFLEPWCEIYNGTLDYVILKLKKNGNAFPPGLCGQIAPQPSSGLIYLIGHPDGQIKKIDDCAVIPVNQRFRKYSKHQDGLAEISVATYNACPIFTRRTFLSHIDSTATLSYDTCFSSGSSGSPVFTASGKLVAMHAFGHFYEHLGKVYALIEYGYSMVSIMCDIKEKDETFYKLLYEEKNENHNEEKNEKQESLLQDPQIEPMEWV